MKRTLDEVTEIVNELAKALTYAKEARRIANKVHGDDKEVAALLKYVYADVQHVIRLLEAA